MILTDIPVKNALEAEAGKRQEKVKKKVLGTVVPKKEVKSAKRPKIHRRRGMSVLS